MSTQPVRLGLIGLGRWGRAYARTIEHLESACLVSAARRTGERPDWLPEACRFERGATKIIESNDVDAVIIATPPATHAELARRALAAGRPALVEKPLSLGVAEAESLLETAGRSDAFVQVEHTHVASPAFRALVDLVGDPGRVRGIRSRAGGAGPFRADCPVLWDWGAHDVALCVALLGRGPDAVRARVVERRATGAGLGENLRLDLEFGGGVRATVELGNLFADKARCFEVATDDATFRYDDLGEDKLVVLRGGHAEPVPVGPELPLTIAVAEFADRVRTKHDDGESLRLGVDVVRVLERAQAALNAGAG